ncbi:MAG: hypothetical protein AAFQ83_12155 [Bacteroidota bacterium]
MDKVLAHKEVSSSQAFYQQKLQEGLSALASIQKRYTTLSYARALIFLGGIALAYFVFKADPLFGILTGIAVLIGFLYLVKIHNDVAQKRSHLQRIHTICEREMAGLAGDLHAFDGGEMYAEPGHPYTFDLDIFGESSIFQLINRTGTPQGRERLAHWMKHPLQEKVAIEQRQAAIQELSHWNEQGLAFEAKAIGHPGEPKDMEDLLAWSSIPPRMRNRSIFKVLIWVFPILWGLSMIGWILPDFEALRPILGPYQIPGTVPLFLFLLQLGIVGTQIGHTNREQEQLARKSRLLNQYADLLTLIENLSPQSEYLQALQSKIIVDGEKASERIAALGELTYRFEQRLNVFMGILLNGTVMWDFRYVMRLEKWRMDNHQALAEWLDQITEWDAIWSLGRFAFNHPEYTFPEIKEGDFQWKADALGHPLLDPATRIDNDVEIARPGQFLIITGANMAGKSTFLRTVGVNLILAMQGLPVCAQRMTVVPAELMTSMRITDSIADHESYFYAELKRLKFIIDKLREGKPLFIIVDEMLRGTNSKDKQQGSRQFIEQLIKLRGMGMIATHDLSLGTLSEEYGDLAQNKRFEIDMTGGKLTFDYLLQDGISQNLNATFLMKQMGIME